MDCQRERDAEHEHGNRQRIYYTIHEGRPSVRGSPGGEGAGVRSKGTGRNVLGWCFKLLRPVFLTAMGVFGSQSREDTTTLVVVQPGDLRQRTSLSQVASCPQTEPSRCTGLGRLPVVRATFHFCMGQEGQEEFCDNYLSSGAVSSHILAYAPPVPSSDWVLGSTTDVDCCNDPTSAPPMVKGCCI